MKLFNLQPKDLDLEEVTKMLPSTLKNLRTELRNDGVLEIQMPSTNTSKQNNDKNAIERRK